MTNHSAAPVVEELAAVSSAGGLVDHRAGDGGADDGLIAGAGGAAVSVVLCQVRARLRNPKCSRTWKPYLH